MLQIEFLRKLFFIHSSLFFIPKRPIQDFCKKLKRHYIYFRKAEEGIEVIRILHEKMDEEQHLEFNFLNKFRNKPACGIAQRRSGEGVLAGPNLLFPTEK